MASPTTPYLLECFVESITEYLESAKSMLADGPGDCDREGAWEAINGATHLARELSERDPKHPLLRSLWADVNNATDEARDADDASGEY